jgi:hypothetical protein
MVLVAVLALVVVGAALAGGAWYLLGEARRTGRLVAAVLSARTGVPITVARARTDGTRLRLLDVTLAVGPMQVRVAEVEISGGVLPLVAPAGRPLSVLAVGASVRIESGAPSAPAGAASESTRASLRALLDWAGILDLRVEEGRWQTSAADYHFRLVGDKGPDKLTVGLTVGPGEHPGALSLNVRATPLEGDGVIGAIDLSGEPPHLKALWPEAVPVPTRITAHGDVRLSRGGDLAARGRAALGGAPGTPAELEFAAGYEAAHQRLGVSRYTLDWGADFHLAGDAEMTAPSTGGIIRLTTRGTVDGSPASGRGLYRLATHELEAELDLASLDGERLGRRLGLAPLPMAVTARRLVARVSGPDNAPQPAFTLMVRADAVTAAPAPTLAVDAVLDMRLRLAGPRPAAVDRATLRLNRGGGPLALARLSSRGATLWPLAIDARVDDLGRLGAALPSVPALSGWARVAGEARGGERLAFHGMFEAQLPRVQLMADGSVALTDVRASLPVVWGDGEAGRAGSVSVSRVAGYGMTLSDFTSTVQLHGPRLFLPDIQYAQYGGRGKGWLEAFVDGRPMPLRARLEGEKVDLAEFVRETGSQVARITGRVRYVAAAQYERAGGFTAAAHLNSESDGGEVSIDVIERLLDSATVQAETTGVLRQALENLRVFPYESMEGDLRAQGADGHLDLSLRGRKRLGIFPAAVEAINFRNVPLRLLARALGGSTP